MVQDPSPTRNSSSQAYFSLLGSWYPTFSWAGRLRDADRSTFERHFAETCIHPLYWVRRSIRQRLKANAHHAWGRMLDAGAGDRPYESIFRPLVSHYIAIDLMPSGMDRVLNPDVLCDMEALPFGTAAFDTVLFTEVLEHVTNPALAIRNIHRVLTPGGSLICTVPFAFPIHDAHDYRRYTHQGLAQLFQHAGFEVITVQPICGSGKTVAALVNLYLFDLGCYWTAWLYLLSVIIRPVIWVITAFINGMGWLGDKLCRSRHLPIGHLIVCRREKE